MWQSQLSRIRKALSYWGRVWARFANGTSLFDSVMLENHPRKLPEGLCGTFLNGTKLTEEKFALYLASDADRDDVPLK